MSYRNGTYIAFYVNEGENNTNLGANACSGLRDYNIIKLWQKNGDIDFIDSHAKTSQVKDDSSWETLKERLRERLRESKNIILLLGDYTKQSKALREELCYGIKNLKLPLIIAYCGIDIVVREENLNKLEEFIECKLPVYKDLKNIVPTLHVPFRKVYLKDALEYDKFDIHNTIYENKNYFYEKFLSVHIIKK